MNPGSYGAKLSTKTGLVYVVSRKYDESRKTQSNPGMDVWYFTAIDSRTGETAWEKLAGTGRWFDGYWPLVFLGPNETLYADGYGGIFAVRDTNGDEVEQSRPVRTSLPDYAGAPARPHPSGNSRVPQNRLLAPNGFNSCHLDPWMSDTADVAGPLGINPVWSARPLPRRARIPSIPSTARPGSLCASPRCSTARVGC